MRGPEVMGSSLRGGEGPGAMSGELRDSGTGLRRLCSRLECMEEKEGSKLLDSQSEMSWVEEVRREGMENRGVRGRKRGWMENYLDFKLVIRANSTVGASPGDRRG